MREPFAPTPFADVNAVLADFLARMQALFGSHFIGMYLVGSLALGDFDPRSSDIDFIVVTGTDIADDLFDGLQDIHVAMLDPRIDGATLLHITNHLYMSNILAINGQPSMRRDESRDSHLASFLILNDGSPWEDHIVCGHDPGLRARRVCDITVTTDSDGVAQISWREPHIIVMEDRREVEYWEEMTLPLLTD